ncbi:cell division protein ZapA, partial [Thiotrichales bacterium HSG1]|nr:cell division protein ZapA [Thiotrichales bacterium HSG1]
MRKSVPVNLRILSKDYVIACPEEEQDTLITSAQLLEEKTQQVRESGKVATSERIVVISALKITHEY